MKRGGKYFFSPRERERERGGGGGLELPAHYRMNLYIYISSFTNYELIKFSILKQSSRDIFHNKFCSTENPGSKYYPNGVIFFAINYL